MCNKYFNYNIIYLLYRVVSDTSTSCVMFRSLIMSQIIQGKPSLFPGFGILQTACNHMNSVVGQETCSWFLRKLLSCSAMAKAPSTLENHCITWQC